MIQPATTQAAARFGPLHQSSQEKPGVRSPLSLRRPLLLVALVASCADVLAQTRPPQKPKPRPAPTAAERDRLVAILEGHKDAYLACGDPRAVPTPEPAKSPDTPTPQEKLARMTKNLAFFEATTKIEGCQGKVFEAARPDLTKTGASDEAILAAMVEWQKTMDERLKALRAPAAGSSPQPDKP